MQKPNEKRVSAKRKQLEAEVELLESAIADAIHWDRLGDLRGPLVRIRKLSQELATEFNLGSLE